MSPRRKLRKVFEDELCLNCLAQMPIEAVQTRGESPYEAYKPTFFFPFGFAPPRADEGLVGSMRW